MSDSFSIPFIQKWRAFRGLLASAFRFPDSQRLSIRINYYRLKAVVWEPLAKRIKA